MTPYTFNQHRHNYAVWTAARAAQRGFTTTANIKTAIDNSDLRKFSKDTLNYSVQDFDTFHKTCCHQLIKAFEKISLGKATYGRVAKIISIYLKTSIILCNKGEGNKCKIIHPPIDNILLTQMANNLKELKDLKNE